MLLDWVSDANGYMRLDSGDSLLVDENGFIRVDATAGKKNCTPGKTVPCGNVCRTPANCKKSSTRDRIQTIGKENLKEFAEARRKEKASDWKERRSQKQQEIQSLSTQRGVKKQDVIQIQEQAALVLNLSRKDARYEDSEAIYSEIVLAAKESPRSIRIVKDGNENIQSVAQVTKGRGHLYVEMLATAPWNISGSDSKRVKGAGTKAMEAIILEAVEQKKPVKLRSVQGALSFYQKIGFTQDRVNSFNMTLSLENAKVFLEKRGVRLDAPFDGYYEELIALETLANGAFAKK